MGYRGNDASDQGPRSRADPVKRGPNIRLTVIMAVLVVAMLVLAGIQLVGRTPEGPPRDDEVIRGDVVHVWGDVVWEGRTGMMDMPVLVRDGGRLKLLDCDLQVPLEFLVLDGHSWFRVEEEGSLVLDNSTVTLVAPEGFDNLVYIDSPGYVEDMEDYLREGPAFISRAVDLRGTTDPRLVFHMDPRGRGGSMLFAVQPTPAADPEVVEEINVTDTTNDGWRQYSISLSHYKGTIVNVYIIAAQPVLMGALLRDFRVVDGDTDLPGDSFPRGRPDEDHWFEWGFDRLVERMGSDDFHDIFFVEGELELGASRVLAPPLPRTWRDDTDGPIKSLLESYGQSYNMLMLSRGGDINIEGGSLLMDDSQLDNVTVVASQARVEIRRSEVVADREPVTLYECGGVIEDTVLRSAYGEDDEVYSHQYHEGPLLWALSIWGDSGEEPFLLVDSVFRDSVIGVDISNPSVGMTGCTLINCSDLGVWDHDGGGLGNWQAMNTSNDFSECRGDWFLRSHDCEITFDGPNYPRDWNRPDIEAWGRIDAIDGDWMVPMEKLWVHRGGATLYMPTVSVNRSGVPTFHDWIDLDLWTSWGGRKIETIGTDEREHAAIFTGDNGTGNPEYGVDRKPRYPSFDLDTLEPGMGEGEVAVGAYVDMYKGYSNTYPAPVTDLRLEVVLDGTILDSIDVLSDGELDEDENYILDFTTTVPPGVHALNLSLSAIPENETAWRVLGGANISIARADPGTMVGELLESLDDPWMLYLLLDPGTHLELYNVPWYVYPLEEYAFFYLELLFYEDTSLTIKDPTSPYHTELSIDSYGPGVIVLEDVDLDYVTASIHGGWLEVTNLTSAYLSGFYIDGDVSMTGLDTSFYWTWSANASIKIDRSTIDTNEQGIVSLWGTDLVVLNSTVHGNGSTMDADVGPGNASFINTTFEGVNLSLDLDDEFPMNLTVVDCRFSGQDSFLVLGSDSMGPVPPDNVTSFNISGNRFEGPSAGIVAPTWALEHLADNQMVDGASYRVWYRTDIVMAPMNDSHYDWSYDLVVLPGQDPVMSSWYYEEMDYYTEEFETYLQVLVAHETLSQVGHPPDVRTMVVRGNWRSGDVWWFGVVSMTAGEVTVHVPDWGHPRDNAVSLVRSVIGNSWWAGQ